MSPAPVNPTQSIALVAALYQALHRAGVTHVRPLGILFDSEGGEFELPVAIALSLLGGFSGTAENAQGYLVEALEPAEPSQA